MSGSNQNDGRAIRAAVGAVMEGLEGRRLLAAPSLVALPDVAVPIDKTIQVPLTSSDADGDRVTYAVATTGGLTANVRPGDNTFLRMNVRDFGALEFQLFDADAPDTVRRIVGLANADYYDGLTFHRVVDDFVIQGGDPVGDGTGDVDKDPDDETPREFPEFTFDDEFDPDDLFTQSGTLAMANGGKDTNGSQFFVTLGAQRFLDFNHTILGQLVRGFDTLAEINGVETDANGAPIDDVVIDSVEVVDNETDGVLTVRSNGGAGGNVTVTATDSNGQSSSDTFAVAASPDTSNSPPILGRIDDRITAVGRAVTFNVSSEDLEGDAVTYNVAVIDPSTPRGLDPQRTIAEGQTTALGTATISGNAVTFTPRAGYRGPVDLLIGVQQTGANGRGSTAYPFDTQRVRIAVGDQEIALSGVNVDAARDVAFTNAVVATIFDDDLGGNESAFAAEVDWGDGTVDVGADEGVFVVATGRPGEYNVVASHTYTGFVANVPTTVTVNGNNGVRAVAVARAEVRALATLDAARRILFVNGTDGIDIVSATGDPDDNELSFNINGTIETFPLDAIGRIEIQCYAGGDQVRLGAGVTDTYAFGDEGDDVLVGGNGNDTLSGGSGKNFLYGMDGDDRLQGSNGRDYLDGGLGADRLYGDLDRDRDTGRGQNDTIFGGGGADSIFAGAGDDYVEGGTSNDPIRADFGNDTILGNRGRDILDGGPGTNFTLRSDLDNDDELVEDSDLLINLTIVDEIDRIEPFFA